MVLATFSIFYKNYYESLDKIIVVYYNGNNKSSYIRELQTKYVFRIPVSKSLHRKRGGTHDRFLLF